MKKIIRLTENDLIRIVKRVIKEQESPILDKKIEELKGRLSDLNPKDSRGNMLEFGDDQYLVTIDDKNISFSAGDDELETELDLLMQEVLNTRGNNLSYNHTRKTAREIEKAIRMLIKRIESGLN